MKNKTTAILLVAKGIGAIVLVCAFFLNIALFVQQDSVDGSVILASLKAQADEGDEDGEAVKRLKVVNCTCPNGQTGKTAKCRTDGDKEKCTPTQQGLNGCYSTSMFNPGELLCEPV